MLSLRLSRPALLLAPLPLLAPAPLAAADTWTLGPEDSIQDAIAAAAPGDVLLLQAGEYVEAGGLVIDKPLTLIGAGSDRTRFDAVAQGPFDQPLPLYVVGLAPGEEVHVVGLTLESSPQLGLFSGVAVIQDCLGPVVLADVRGLGTWGAPPFLGVPATVQVRSSAQVLLDGCFVSGAGSPALLVEDSSLWINASTVFGASGSLSSLDGSPGLRAVESTVQISRSALGGGNGWSGALFFPSAAGDGGVGIRAEKSSILLRGGPDNALLGGAGGLSQSGTPPSGAGAAAAFLDAGSSLATAPDAVLIAGLDGDGTAAAPILDPAGGGVLVPGPERLATLRTTPNAASLGASSTTEVAGEPFGVAVIGFSVGQGPALALFGIDGAIVLDLAHFGTTPGLPLDASGAFALSSTLPSSPSLAGVVITRQAVTVSPTVLVSVSPPSFQALLP